jgi:endoglucanase
VAEVAAPALPRAPREFWKLPPRAHDALGDDERARLLELTRDVLRLPTAPYAEDLQVRGVLAFAAARPGLKARLDVYGNGIVEWRGARAGPADARANEDTRAGASASARSSSRTRARSTGRTQLSLAYSAHLDHPGLLYDGKRGGAHAATLYGGVPLAYLPGAPVRFFELDGGTAIATARVAKAARDARGRVRVELREWIGRAARGTPGMWDLSPGRISGQRLHARVCDDLLGAVAILHVLDRLWRERSASALTGIFTRAEETGFVGCLGLLRSGALDPATRVIGLECSPQRASARPGRGPVVRVGDAASVFDPELSRALHAAASGMRTAVKDFVFQRALMDGGRCESTAYNAHGVRAGGACLALGNYHNCGSRGRGENGRIAPEWVDWGDHEGLCALLYAFAHSWNAAVHPAQPAAALEPLWRNGRAALATSARRMLRGARERRTDAAGRAVPTTGFS